MEENEEIIREALYEFHKKKIASMFEHEIDIYENSNTYNEKTFRYEEGWQKVKENIPCRVSFNRKETSAEKYVTSSNQNVTVFTSPDLVIKNSSKVVARVNGEVLNLINTSPPAVYLTHREYVMEYEERGN